MGIVANKLKGFVNKQHQPYTEYNQEIINWLEENADGITDSLGYNKFIFTQNDDTDSFYTYMDIYRYDVYYTNEQFKEWIGMTKKKDCVRNKLEELIKTDGKVVIEYLKELLAREDSIRKELQFAEAKKERLEKHIEVLKSKLQ